MARERSTKVVDGGMLLVIVWIMQPSTVTGEGEIAYKKSPRGWFGLVWWREEWLET